MRPPLQNFLIFVAAMKYKRVLLKLSGESLMGSKQFGIDADRVMEYAEELKDAIDTGVRVDGIDDSDPEKNPKAKKYDFIKYSEALKKKLNVMDLTAFTLCQENHLPIIVFDMNKGGNLKRILNGEKIGTMVND